jgi:hypothetical protein
LLAALAMTNSFHVAGWSLRDGTQVIIIKGATPIIQAADDPRPVLQNAARAVDLSKRERP